MVFSREVSHRGALLRVFLVFPCPDQCPGADSRRYEHGQKRLREGGGRVRRLGGGTGAIS